MGLSSLLPWCARCSREKTKDSKRNFVKVDSPQNTGASSARSPSLRFNDKSEVPRGFSHQRAMARSEIKVASHFAFMCWAKEQGQRHKVLKLLIKLQWNYLLALDYIDAIQHENCYLTFPLISPALWWGYTVNCFQVQTCYWQGCRMLLKSSPVPVLLKWQKGHFFLKQEKGSITATEANVAAEKYIANYGMEDKHKGKHRYFLWEPCMRSLSSLENNGS